MSTTYKTYAREGLVKQGDSDALLAACKRWLAARVAFRGPDNVHREANCVALVQCEDELELVVRRVT